MIDPSEAQIVLVVEDDEALNYAISRYLGSKGYKVIEATGAMAALRELDKGGVKLVITDINLQPNEPHGVSLGLMVRNKFPDVSIVFITGRRDLVAAASDSIPGEVLFKPVDLDLLARKIEDLLRLQ